MVVTLPVGQLVFNSAGTVEFKSISAREMEAWGRSQATSVTETSVRGSQRGQARIFGRAGKSAGPKQHQLGTRTPFKNGRQAQMADRAPGQGGETEDGQENYSYLSDFLRSQIDMQKGGADPRSTINILQYNRDNSRKYNN